MAGLRCSLFVVIFFALSLPDNMTGEGCSICRGGAGQGCCVWKCFGDFFSGRMCDDGALIHVTGAEFGISACPIAGSCCPDAADCRVPVVDYRPEHMDLIYKHCNGKSECDLLQVEWAANIVKCGYRASNYEVIYYDCVSDKPTTTTTTTTTTHSTTNPSQTTISLTLTSTHSLQPSTSNDQSSTHMSTTTVTNSSITTFSSTKTSAHNLSSSTQTTEVSTIDSSTNTETSEVPPTGLSSGAVAGIVIGVILFILLLLLLGFCFMVRRKNPNWPQIHNWKEPFVNIKSYLPGDLGIHATRTRTRKSSAATTATPPAASQTNGVVRDSNVTIVRTPLDAVIDNRVPDENLYYTIDDRVKSVRRTRGDSFNSIDFDEFDGDGDSGAEPKPPSSVQGEPPVRVAGKAKGIQALSRDVSVRSENQYEVIKDEDIRDLRSLRSKKPQYQYDRDGLAREAPEVHAESTSSKTDGHATNQAGKSTPAIMVENNDYDSLHDSGSKDTKPKDRPTIMISNTEYDSFPDTMRDRLHTEPAVMYGNSAYDSLGDDGGNIRRNLTDKDKAMYTKVNIKDKNVPLSDKNLERYSKEDLSKDSPRAGKRGLPPGALLHEPDMYENTGYDSDHSAAIHPSDTETYYNYDEKDTDKKTRMVLPDMQDNHSQCSSNA